MATTLLNPVRVATDKDVILNAAPTIIDGKTLVNNDRVLVKSQTTLSQNGIYVYNSSTSSLSRSLDFANGMTSSTLESAIVFVKEGDKYGETGWIVATDAFAVGDNNPIQFVRFSINTKESNDVQSSITYRFDKGYPLTNLELDNNFKFLASELDSRVRTTEYTAAALVTRLNTLSVVDISVSQLQGFAPNTLDSANTIVVRDGSGNFSANIISADLNGNASSADNATTADTANSLTEAYVVPISQGGTGSTSAAAAIVALGGLPISGASQMTGRLTLASSGAGASLRITPSTITPSSIGPGDVWYLDGEIYYRDGSVTQRFAKLDSPVFTGSPALTNTPSDVDLTKIANVNYVNNRVSARETVINASIALKSDKTYVDLADSNLQTQINNRALIASPNFAGTPTISGVGIATLASPNFTGTPTISGVAIATQTYVDNKETLLNSNIAAKASTSYLDSQLNLKADKANTYTIAQTYTRVEVDSLLSSKANLANPALTGTPTVNGSPIATHSYLISNYWTSSQVQTAIDTKPTTSPKKVYSNGDFNFMTYTGSPGARERRFLFRINSNETNYGLSLSNPDQFIVDTQIADYYWYTLGYQNDYFSRFVVSKQCFYGNRSGQGWRSYLLLTCANFYNRNALYPNYVRINIYVPSDSQVTSLTYEAADDEIPTSIYSIYDPYVPYYSPDSGSAGFGE